MNLAFQNAIREEHMTEVEGMRLVVHCRKEEYDVYVGRGSKWGNPFKIGRDGDRADVIRLYRKWIIRQPELMAALPALRGKVLGCWCAPAPCHGDVLVELAVAQEESPHTKGGE